jgi:hypothetical protein
VDFLYDKQKPSRKSYCCHRNAQYQTSSCTFPSRIVFNLHACTYLTDDAVFWKPLKIIVGFPGIVPTCYFIFLAKFIHITVLWILCDCTAYVRYHLTTYLNVLYQYHFIHNFRHVSVNSLTTIMEEYKVYIWKRLMICTCVSDTQCFMKIKHFLYVMPQR